MESVNASQFPEVYRDLGINTTELGCIMLVTDPVTVSPVIDPGDLYYSDTEEFVQGIVSEDKPHVTLLYGLMSHGPAMQKHVDAVLDGWAAKEVQVESVEAWAQQDSPYACLVAKLVPAPELLEGNARIRLLPHIDTFPAYNPHLTLAYVRNDPGTIAGYVDELTRRLAKSVITVTGLDYGK